MSVITVLGAVDPASLGRTLTHEHLYLDFNIFYRAPPTELTEYLSGDISIENLGFVQRYPYSNKKNILFTDEDAVKYDLQLFKKHGGGTIVENTTIGLQRNIPLIKKLAVDTGVNIIAGAGFYVDDVQKPSERSLSTEAIYDIMKQDMCVGCPEDGIVKCGFLGEIASNCPNTDFEKRLIAATGILQEELKCPVSFHPGRQAEAPAEIMQRYCEAGGCEEKAVMSHLDRTLTQKEDLLRFADDYRCYLQQDLFGTEVLTYQFSPSTQMPSDRQRLDRIQLLAEEGYLNRILMSHDIHTRQRLIKYGGHGFMHIFANVLPKMRQMGFTSEVIDTITIGNPKTWLTW